MRIRLAFACLGVLAASVLSSPRANAFTLEGPAVDNQYAAPKFDLEEQAKNFTKDGGSGPSLNDKGQLETPLGSGKLQFGVQQQGSTFGFSGSRAGRADFERMVTPESLR